MRERSDLATDGGPFGVELMNYRTLLRLAVSLAALVGGPPIVAGALSASAVADTPLAVYPVGAAPATAVQVIGPVSGQICRRPWDAAATDAEAVAPLQAKARAMGANAVIDVSLDRTRADLKAPCWQRVSARGMAVVLGPTSSR